VVVVAAVLTVLAVGEVVVLLLLPHAATPSAARPSAITASGRRAWRTWLTLLALTTRMRMSATP
jgi:hypothetical protein